MKSKKAQKFKERSMYKLYYSPGTCSLATHVLLNELNAEFTLIAKSSVSKFLDINAADTVPVLIDGETKVQEGAAIALYLMEKHKSSMLPDNPDQRSKAIQWMLLANASMHPAYSKVFFISKNSPDPEATRQILNLAGENVSRLWKVVDERLEKNKFVLGDQISMADLMLTVYANWNNNFPGLVNLGSNSERMVREVSSRPAFRRAIEREKIKFRV
jgi:glutathione S-transferase